MHPKLLESTVQQCRDYMAAGDCHGEAPPVERLIDAVVQLADARPKISIKREEWESLSPAAQERLMGIVAQASAEDARNRAAASYHEGRARIGKVALGGAPGSTDAERAEWLADKIVALGDYAKEAAAMLRRWPDGVVGQSK